LRGIDRGEFLRQVGEVGEREFARVGLVANAEKTDRVLDNVAMRCSSVAKVYVRHVQ
jgi:hypothetical protein